jgi:hypothetical protein
VLQLYQVNDCRQFAFHGETAGFTLFDFRRGVKTCPDNADLAESQILDHMRAIRFKCLFAVILCTDRVSIVINQHFIFPVKINVRAGLLSCAPTNNCSAYSVAWPQNPIDAAYLTEFI